MPDWLFILSAVVTAFVFVATCYAVAAVVMDGDNVDTRRMAMRTLKAAFVGEGILLLLLLILTFG